MNANENEATSVAQKKRIAVYDKDGKEIDRIDGNVYVSGSKYPEVPGADGAGRGYRRVRG